MFLKVEISLQAQESHPGTVGGPNPGPGHPEKWSQNRTLTILLGHGYHQGVSTRVQKEGCSSLLVTSHSIYPKGEKVLSGGEHGQDVGEGCG